VTKGRKERLVMVWSNVTVYFLALPVKINGVVLAFQTVTLDFCKNVCFFNLREFTKPIFNHNGMNNDTDPPENESILITPTAQNYLLCWATQESVFFFFIQVPAC
jgi:hypothetical protein